MNKIKFIDSVSQAEKDDFQIQKLIGKVQEINRPLGLAFEYDSERFKHESNNTFDKTLRIVISSFFIFLLKFINILDVLNLSSFIQ